jgi:hypothetical protein
MNPPTTMPTAKGDLWHVASSNRGLSEHASASASEKARFVLPLWVWIIAGTAAVWGAFSANPILTPVSIAVLLGCVQLLWRRGEPPVLVFACSMQWLQASAIIFYTNFYGVSVEEAGGGPQLETATWLSLIAVFVLALGMRLALIRCSRSEHKSLLGEVLRVNIGSAFLAYLVSFFIAVIAERLAFAIPAVTQLIYALITLKWIAVFIVAYAIMEQHQGYIFLAGIVFVEMAVGLLGFFAGFKSVLFVLLVVALASPLALRSRRLIITIAAAVVLFCFGVIWSAIKAEYREFLSQGTEQQSIAVSAGESAGKLSDLIGNFSWDNFSDGLDALVLRVGYTKLFALTLLNVPDIVPYERGGLWLGSLKHIVTPRLLFPEKATIDDSERTALYAGVQVAGVEQGTSIGIGYVAESYVDFGPLWMFAPIVLLGIFYGLIYRMLVVHSRAKLICTAIASSILIFGAYTIETSNIKIVGGIMTELLVIGTMYLLFGQAFKTWLEHGLK